VKKGPGIFVIFVFVLCFSVLPASNGQILKDTASINLLKRGADDIYNFRFDQAHAVTRKLDRSYPQHPVIFLLEGMMAYWENYPLTPSSPVSLTYENDMRTCIRVCEESHNHEYYPEYLMVNLGARGMLLMFYADNNMSDKVSPLAKSTYRYLRQSFDYTSVFPDFYFFTGLYNYYRETYPDAHPIYKVLAFLFPKGSREKGLVELQIASQNAIMLKAESLFFLSLISINFENDYQQSYLYSKALHERYPSNIQYLAEYLKNLLLTKRYEEAESLIRSTENKTQNTYYLAQLTVFKGILREKKYHDYDEAIKYYNKGVNDLSAFDYYGREFASYACFGLSRIYDIRGDKRNRKLYRKKALELTDYKKINFDD
jgi:hypothetical protein